MVRRAVQRTKEQGSNVVTVANVQAALEEVTSELGRPMPAHLQQAMQAAQEEEERERRQAGGEAQAKRARKSP